MSNFWRLTHRVDFEPGVDIVFPATAILQIELGPSDYFGHLHKIYPRTSLNGEPTSMSFDLIKGLVTTNDPPPTPFAHEVNFPTGTLYFHDNYINVAYQVAHADDVLHLLEWISVRITQMLPIHTGIYFEIISCHGRIGNRVLTVGHQAENLSATFARADSETRLEAVDAALMRLDQRSNSYGRFEVASRYYKHALRLMSPIAINFPILVTRPDVLLNLAKCIEILLGTSNRDAARDKLRAFGFTPEETESAFISILVVRNKLDVGHAASGIATRDDVSTLRRFVDRSIQNIGELLRRVQIQMMDNQDLLPPFTNDSADERAKLVEEIKTYLAAPQLAGETPVIIITRESPTPPLRIL